MLFGKARRNKQERERLLAVIVKAIDILADDCAEYFIKDVQMLEANSSDDIDYNALLEKHAKRYFKNVENLVFNAYRDQPNVYERMIYVKRNGHICGWEDISDDEVIMAGRLYWICLYALLGEEDNEPGLFVALNHREYDKMMEAIEKRGSKYLTK